MLSQPQLSSYKIGELVALILQSCCENKELININVTSEHSAWYVCSTKDGIH